MIEVTGLSVRFGGVTPIDDVSLTMPSGTSGLIGPNGAGKTTFLNVLSGLVAARTGAVTVDGVGLLGMRPFQRARWGLRRTFQQEQLIEELSVRDNLIASREHTARDAHQASRGVAEAMELVGLDVPPETPARTLSSRQRRLLEIARTVVGAPRLVLLDEPAAGMSDQETQELAGVIRAIGARTGADVILVDHDMSLVASCCETTAVLDFGKLIAAGPTADVLRDNHVQRAYLGTVDV